MARQPLWHVPAPWLAAACGTVAGGDRIADCDRLASCGRRPTGDPTACGGIITSGPGRTPLPAATLSACLVYVWALRLYPTSLENPASARRHLLLGSGSPTLLRGARAGLPIQPVSCTLQVYRHCGAARQNQCSTSAAPARTLPKTVPNQGQSGMRTVAVPHHDSTNTVPRQCRYQAMTVRVQCQHSACKVRVHSDQWSTSRVPE